jgi:lysozyme
LIGAAVIIAAPLAAKWEGYAAKTYKDPVGIPTYCYGETENVSKDPMRIYAKTECMALLRKRMARDYAPKILQCIPQFQQMPQDRARYIFGALIDASYNAGWAGVCRSPMKISIATGKLAAACNAMPGWYVTARDRRTGVRKKLAGLVNRRIDEARVCLKGAV